MSRQMAPLLQAALEQLLVSLFDAEGFRRHLRLGPEGQTISELLPEGAPMRQLVHVAVDVLIRRGLVDIAFFDRLRQEVPAREPEILKCCSVWIAARSGGEDCPPIRAGASEVSQAIEELEQAYRAREECIIRGVTTEALDRRILELRRIIRRGPELSPGEPLLAGRYRLIEKLGSGGFATVWKAYDRERRGLVAIKVLHGQWASERSYRERFDRGARTMLRLRHPNIVQVLREPCDDEGFHFYVMDLVDGVCLHRAVLGKQIGEAAALAAILAVCDALAFSHAAGFVHRDVKPANILIDRAGRAYLSDFDLIRGRDTTGGTQVGAGIGSVHYAAPEATIDASSVDARADVYGMGMVLLFTLLGRELHHDVVYAAHQQRLTGVGGYAAVICKAAALGVDQRYPTIVEFAAALRAGGPEDNPPTIEQTIEVTRPVPTAKGSAEAKPRLRTAPPAGKPVPAGKRRSYAFIVIQGGERGRRFDVAGDEVWIGRGDGNDICLKHQNVSRTHAKLSVEVAGVRLTDNNSTNGTYVNEGQIVEAWLRPGDYIQIGKIVLKFVHADDVAAMIHEMDQTSID